MNKIIIVRDRPQSQLQAGTIWREFEKSAMFEEYPHVVFDCECSLCSGYELRLAEQSARGFMAALAKDRPLEPSF